MTQFHFNQSSNPKNPSSTFFLIGMPGSGKSYWGKWFAKKLKERFYDLDHLIESAEEKTIAEIFAEDGEVNFRKAEAKILRWFAEKKKFVLATGGGTPCFHGNMKWMNEHGITIWIDEPVDVLFERLLPEKDHRPLIKNFDADELRSFLSDKLKERTPFYSQAKYHLERKDISEKAFIEILKDHA